MDSYYSYPPIDTVDTTRILGDNPIDFNIYVTKMIYPSKQVEWRPNAIILVPLTSYHYGLLASPIVHFPNNAPLIFTDPNELDEETLNEIIRLSPSGTHMPAQIFIVGPISFRVENELKSSGFSVLRITGSDPITAAGEALEFRYSIPPETHEGLDHIIIVSAERYEEGIPAAYFSAHMGVPILFTFKDQLPHITKQKIQKYPDKNIYILGNQRVISDHVLEEIMQVSKGEVSRISGDTPYEVAVNFSKFHSSDGMFGWNINEKDGWAFCFGDPQNWAFNLSSCLFAHLGKHSPLLYINKSTLPKVTAQYVLSLNPLEKHPPKPPFMHGYVVGGFNIILSKVQISLEEILHLRS